MTTATTQQKPGGRNLWTISLGVAVIVILAALAVIPIVMLGRALPDPDTTSYDDLNRWIVTNRTTPTPPPAPVTTINGTPAVALLGQDGICWYVPVDTTNNPVSDTPQRTDPNNC